MPLLEPLIFYKIAFFVYMYDIDIRIAFIASTVNCKNSEYHYAIDLIIVQNEISKIENK